MLGEKYKTKTDEKENLTKEDLNDIWAAISDIVNTFNDFITEILNRIKKIEIDIDILKKKVVNIYNTGDTVDEGDGIDITVDDHDPTKIISVDVGDGLQIDGSDQVAVDLKSNSGLEIVSSELAVKVDTTADSIHMTSAGLHVNFKVCA